MKKNVKMSFFSSDKSKNQRKVGVSADELVAARGFLSVAQLLQPFCTTTVNVKVKTLP